LVPFEIELLGALITIDCSVAAVTVSVTEFDEIPFWVAVITVEPVPRPAASPLGLMLAAAGFEEVQVAELVRFWMLPSVNVPVAVN
jgi:hypothetical protein